MKKSTLIGFNILTIFILFSLSYQPIIAENPIIKTKQEIEIIEEEECGCEEGNLKSNYGLFQLFVLFYI